MMKSSNSIIIKYGIIAFLAGIILSIISYLVNPGDFLSNTNVFNLVGLLIMLGLIVMAGIEHRKSNGGYLGFGQAFKTTFFTSMIALVLGTIFTFTFIAVVEPTMWDDMMAKEMAKAVEEMEESGMSEEQIDSAMQMTESIMAVAPIIGIVFMVIFYAVVCLIISAVIKKNKPISYDDILTE